MSRNPENGGTGGRAVGMFLSCVIGCAVTGYFVGINDGVPRDDKAAATSMVDVVSATESDTSDPGVVPAIEYSAVRRSQTGPTSRWNPKIEGIEQPEYDLFAEFTPDPDAKVRSTETRAERRAFNGAPPIIPHAIEGTSDAACYSCHGKGMRIGDRVANAMSHGYLANCTQCHAPPPPKPFQEYDEFSMNTFVGLPAPTNGERAFSGAPPTVPHSTWMREQCLSCHGRGAGWEGLESTHPWRTSCQQCHAPSASLNQAPLQNPIGFLPRINLVEE